MTGRRSHGRLSALNGVVHQGSGSASADFSASTTERPHEGAAHYLHLTPKRLPREHRSTTTAWGLGAYRVPRDASRIPGVEAGTAAGSACQQFRR